MGYPTWIYHETEEPKIIDSDNYELFHKQGWRDSPALFIKIADFDIDLDDVVGIQNLGDTVQGVANSLNDGLAVGKMDITQLVEFASEHYGKELDDTKGVRQLRKEVKAMINGNSE
jgi:hypothetical protein